MSAQLDTLVAALDLPDDCDPQSRTFRRGLLLMLRAEQLAAKRLGRHLRLLPKRCAR